MGSYRPFWEGRIDRVPRSWLVIILVRVSHIATDGQSVCVSWCRAPSGVHDQIFVTVRQLRSCPLGGGGGAPADEGPGPSFVRVGQK
jgi:hypothetical protein